MKLEISLYDRFYVFPRFWKMKQRHAGKAAEYFGHTFAFTVHWLWFELMGYIPA